MSRHALCFIVLPLFLILTGWSLLHGGIMGILNTASSPGGLQVFVDLVISLVLLLTFLVPHAKAHGRNPLIWVTLTLLVGSIGPLLYFATDKPASV